ncbi:MAG: hypothetical protein L0Y50_11265 [Beijerinckiaceae bacterium]|nr:hypothetical protein [Beijerinckiaceae bacterium]MCI0736827.1 hypothetical protein [Beijerinckiaceae bacterium]
MTRVDIPQVDTLLPSGVERGETIIITRRHGKSTASLVPGDSRRQEEIAKALADLRKTLPRLTLDEILPARH